MKISNKAKDYIVITLICVVVIWILSGAMWWVASLFAQDSVYLTDTEKINKYYAEESIKSEMRYFAMKEYMDNITVEEYIETFFSKEDK